MKLLCDELVSRGHDVTLVASADCNTRARLMPVVELNLTDLAIEGRLYNYEYYINSMLADLARAQHQFDLIHLHCTTAWLPAAATLNVPTLFTLHTLAHVDDEWVMRRWPNVAVNGISHSQIRALGLTLQRQFPVVHNSCDFAAYNPRYTAGDYLAFLGRFSPQKNPLSAIRIAQACGLPIVLAGKPQNQKEQIYFETEVQPLIGGQNVRWIGPVDHAEKVEMLRQAKALIFPIEWDEPFGLVMIEAMACGTPVVAHKRGAVEEVIDQGVTGFYASSLEQLPALVAEALGLKREEVRRHAESRFGSSPMVTAYEKLYEQIVACSR